jgi:hypothetical protein
MELWFHLGAKGYVVVPEEQSLDAAKMVRILSGVQETSRYFERIKLERLYVGDTVLVYLLELLDHDRAAG